MFVSAINFVVSIFVVFLTIQVRALSTTTEVVLPVQSYYVTSTSGTSSISVNFSRTQNQLGTAYQYKMLIQNADGQEHLVMPAASCKNLDHVQKLLCLSSRTANLVYVNNVRVQSADIILNGSQVTSVANFNKNTVSLEIPLSNINMQNTLQMNLAGGFGSYIQVSLNAVVTNTDQLAPVLTASQGPNSLTNNSNIHISISDQSSVSSDIYKDNVLIQTTDLKEFDITLSEGTNNFIIRSKDQFGNQAPDFILTNIQLDTTPPGLNNNLKANYYFNVLPNSISLEFYASESLSSLNVNGQEVAFNSSVGFYTYALPVTQAGVQNLVVTATDLAGNAATFNYSLNVALDNVPPQIVLGDVPVMIISDSYLLSVHIDELNASVTTVSINGVVSAPIFEKDFSYLIEFPIDESISIEITSTDAAQNTTTKSFQITKNTQAFLAQVTSPLNNTSVNSRLFDLQILANKPIQSVVVNSITYAVAANQFSVSLPVQMYSDGAFELPVQVTDIFGAVSTATAKFSIQTNSISAWNYMQCPVEQ